MYRENVSYTSSINSAANERRLHILPMLLLILIDTKQLNVYYNIIHYIQLVHITRYSIGSLFMCIYLYIYIYRYMVPNNHFRDVRLSRMQCVSINELALTPANSII